MTLHNDLVKNQFDELTRLIASATSAVRHLVSSGPERDADGPVPFVLDRSVSRDVGHALSASRIRAAMSPEDQGALQEGLHRAIVSNESWKVHAALHQGALINAALNPQGDNAMHLAALGVCTRRVLRQLLRARDGAGELADLTRTNRHGHTPIHLAVNKENIPFLEEVANLLRQHHGRLVDLTLRDDVGFRAVDLSEEPRVLAALDAVARLASRGS